MSNVLPLRKLRMATTRVPVEIDPLDPDEVVPVTFDWGPYMDSVNILALSGSEWTVSPGLLVGDGSPVTKGGFTISPPPPSLLTRTTTAYVYVDDALEMRGKTVMISNRVQLGSQVIERSATTLVRDL